MHIWGFPGVLAVMNPLANAGDVREVLFLGQEDPLEKEMATHSSIVAWKSPWTEEPGGLYSPWGQNRVRCDLATKQRVYVCVCVCV